LGVNRPSQNHGGSREQQLQHGTNGHDLPALMCFEEVRLPPLCCAANRCAGPAHYASQRPTMRPKIGSVNGDASGSQ
jgi:hypothetical protein